MVKRYGAHRELKKKEEARLKEEPREEKKLETMRLKEERKKAQEEKAKQKSSESESDIRIFAHVNYILFNRTWCVTLNKEFTKWRQS